MAVTGAERRITAELAAWEGVVSAPHRFGGVEYRLGSREIGHLHGDHLVDIPFPKRTRDAVVASGRAVPHHLLPDTGWVSIYLRQPDDVERALVLLRESYELARRQRDRA